MPVFSHESFPPPPRLPSIHTKLSWTLLFEYTLTSCVYREGYGGLRRSNSICDIRPVDNSSGVYYATVSAYQDLIIWIILTFLISLFPWPLFQVRKSGKVPPQVVMRDKGERNTAAYAQNRLVSTPLKTVCQQICILGSPFSWLHHTITPAHQFGRPAEKDQSQPVMTATAWPAHRWEVKGRMGYPRWMQLYSDWGTGSYCKIPIFDLGW